LRTSAWLRGHLMDPCLSSQGGTGNSPGKK
jgi:hypothetical protein